MCHKLAIYLQHHGEEAEKEVTTSDEKEGFDITLTKHKGQVFDIYTLIFTIYFFLLLFF